MIISQSIKLGMASGMLVVFLLGTSDVAVLLANPRSIMTHLFLDCLSAATVLLDITGIPSWHFFWQPQHLERSPLAGLQDHEGKDVMVEDAVLTLFMLIKDC